MKTRMYLLALICLCTVTWTSYAESPSEKSHIYNLIESHENGYTLTADEKALLLDIGYDLEGPSREVDETGGPDAYGYIFRDSEEESGPEYEWVDISGVGTAIDGTGDDGSAGPFELGQFFPFYGAEYTEFWVNSNGFINFTEDLSGHYSNYSIPSSNDPNNAIYPFWDDLHEQDGTIYYYYDEEAGCTRIQYDHWGHHSEVTAWAYFQAALFNDGRIIFYYNDFSEDWTVNSETIGIESADGESALMVSFNMDPENYPYAGLAIEFSQTDPDATITGIITDAETGDGIEGATVTLGGGSGVTNSVGTYEILDAYSGTWDMLVEAHGYYDYVEEVDILPGVNVFNAALDEAPPEPEWNEVDYFWLDILDDGTDLQQGDDTWIYIDFAEIGWNNFTWYNIEYTGIYVCSNGWLAFIYDESGTIYYNELPDPADPNASFFLLADDLNPAAAGSVYAGFEDENFVVTYDGVNFYGNADHPVTMQAVFTPNGAVYFNYATIAFDDYTGNHSIGFEDETGERGASIYHGEEFQFPANESSFYIGRPGGTLQGTITHVIGVPLEGYVVEIWTTDFEEMLYSTLSDEEGFYQIEHILPGVYHVKSYGMGVRSRIYENIEIIEDETTILDIELGYIPEPILHGWVQSADTPDTYLPNVMVQIPSLGVFDITDEEGFFELDEVIEGTYNFSITHLPAGSEGYHDEFMEGVLINLETVPITFYLPEIFPPQNLEAMSGDEEVTLIWDPPANHEDARNSLQASIQEYREALVYLHNDGSLEALEKARTIENELLILEESYLHHSPADELDELEDFVGYRIAVIVDGNWTVLPDTVTDETWTVTGLTNGVLYSFAVAADYGYGDDYLVWSDEVQARPMPGETDYVWHEVNYEWVDISDIGNSVPGTGDEGSAGPFEIGFPFSFYGEDLSQFWVNSNGFISFSEIENGYYPNIYVPHTPAPNNALYLFWDDLHQRNGTIYYYHDADNHLTRIQYDNWGYYREPAEVCFTAQIVLHENGQINFYYSDFSDDFPLDSETIGIENVDGTEGVQVSYDDHPENYPYPELGIQFDNQNVSYAMLCGHVYDYATEEGVPEVTVQAEDIIGRTWVGETDVSGYYGVLVDRNALPFDVTFIKQGYNDSTIPDVVLGEEFETQLDAVLTPWGSIVGTVFLSDTEEPAEGACVRTLDADSALVAVTQTDENGWYAFEHLFEDRTESYAIQSCINGYDMYTSEELSWDVENDQFVIEYNLELEPIGPATFPTIAAIEDEFDTGVEILIREPGDFDDEVYIQYDDGTMVDAQSFWPPSNDENGYIGARFFMETPSIVSAGEMRLAVETDPWGAWPNDVNEPVLLMLFAFNSDTQLPEETPLFTSEPVTASVEEPFVSFSPYIGVDDDFVIAMVHTVYGYDREGICVDGAMDVPNLYMHTTGMDGWFYATFSGDPLIRAWVIAYLYGGIRSVEEIVAEQNNLVPPHGLRIADANLEQPLWGFHPAQPAGRSSCLGYTDELDEFLGFNVYISTDGETYTQSNAELIEEELYFVEYGSEWENEEVYLYATAMVDFDGEITESDPSITESVVFNMPPDSPGEFAVDVDNEELTATLTWNLPQTNADGSELVDLEGFNIYRDDELIETVGADETSFVDTVPEQSFYVYTVTAFDEVPNESAHTTPIGVLIGETAFATGFDPGEHNLFEGDGAWEHGEPGDELEEAHSPPNVWATWLDHSCPNNDVGYLTSIITYPILSERAMLSYWHWIDYEFRWSGYSLSISTDNGENWELLEPYGGYPYELYIVDHGGWSGYSNGWTQVVYPLGDYIGENVLFRFHHFTSGSCIWGYYGVAIDDLVIYGTSEALFGALEGTVTDCDDEPVEDATIQVVNTPYSTTTDENGFYHIDEVYQGIWDAEVTHDSYWPMTIEDVTITPDQTTTLDFEELEYPDGDPSTAVIEMIVLIGIEDADSTASADFDLSNVGCGPLAWDAVIDIIDVPWEWDQTDSETGQPLVEGERVFNVVNNNLISPTVSEGPVRPTNELDEVWDSIISFMNLETELGTNGIYGTVLTDEYMYISSFNSDQFYICDLDGNLIEAVDLPGNMDGLIDLSYYQGYLYGISYYGDHGIYRWEHNDLAGAENLYTVPSNQGIGCAYDWDNEWFYFSNWSSMGRWNEDTGVSENVPVPDGISYMTGLSYCPDDPDDYFLWIFSHQNGGAVIYRTNPETGEADAGTTLQSSILAGGFNIGDEYDGDTWSIQCVFQDAPDYVEVYEGYHVVPDWLTMDPEEGQLQPGESANITVTADIRGELYPAEHPGDIPQYSTAEAEIQVNGSYWQGTSIGLFVYFSGAAPGQGDGLPSEYALHQNIPNPFNPTTRILFDLVEAQDVRLTVYNILGQEVARLVDRPMQAGYHEVMWDASAMASGVYFYRVETQVFTSMKKMVLVK